MPMTSHEKTRQAALFEPPPAMYKAIGSWMLSTYAGHILANIQPLIEQSRDALLPLKRGLTVNKEASQKINIISRLDVGKAIRFEVHDVGWDGKVEVLKFGVKRVTDGLLPRSGYGPRYIIGYGKKSLSWKPRRLPLSYKYMGKLSLADVEIGLQIRIRKANERLKKEIQESQDTPPDRGGTLVELVLLQKKLQRYTRKARSYSTRTKKKFPVDVSRWKYLRNQPADAALQAAGWDKITAILDFKGTQYKGGHWDRKKKELLVELGAGTVSSFMRTSEQARTVGEFQDGKKEMLRTLRHELQHVGQDLIAVAKDLPEDAGLPGKSIRDPGYLPSGRSIKMDQESGKYMVLTHPLKDVEFQTRLSDEVDRFVVASRRIPLDMRREALRVWTGASRDKELKGPDGKRLSAVQQFFWSLKKYQRRKWKKAVAEFYKDVIRRGVKIPGGSPSRVAEEQLRQGALFEPPPAMVRDIGIWMRAIFAGHVLAKVLVNIEQVTKAKSRLQDKIQDLEQIRQSLPSKLKKLKHGQAIRIHLGMDPARDYIGIRRMGPPKQYHEMGKERWLKREKETGPIYESGVAYRGKKLNYGYRQHRKVIGDIDEILIWAVNWIDKSIDRHKYRMKSESEDQPLTPYLVEMQLLKREALKYTNKAKAYKSKARKTFPVDLTGWKYVRSNSPVIAKINAGIEKFNKDLKEKVAAAETNLANAKKFYKDLKSGKVSAPTNLDEAKALEIRYDISGYRGDYWFVNNILNLFEKGSGPPDDVIVRLPDGSRVSLREAKGMFKKPLGPEDIDRALQASNWDEITATLDFQGHLTRGGVWKSYKRLLEVDISANNIVSVEKFKTRIQNINTTLRHELQHVGQDVLKVLETLKQEAGLPSRKIRQPGIPPSGYKGYGRGRIRHELRDVEFYTDLADSVDEFMPHIRKIPAKWLRDAVRVYVGEEPISADIPIRLPVSRYFSTWKRLNKAKWRKAVSEFYKELEKRGVDIPRSGKVASLHRQRIRVAQRPPNTISVNIWDDSPPGAPVIVEGDLPDGVDPHSLYDFLAGVATGAGYQIHTGKGPYIWMGSRWPQKFNIENPQMPPSHVYDDALDHEVHQAFLEALVALYKSLSFAGYKLNVYSES